MKAELNLNYGYYDPDTDEIVYVNGDRLSFRRFYITLRGRNVYVTWNSKDLNEVFKWKLDNLGILYISNKNTFGGHSYSFPDDTNLAMVTLYFSQHIV